MSLHEPTRTGRWGVALLACAAALTLAVPATSAHAVNGNTTAHGDLEITVSGAGEACSITLEGSSVTHQNGTVELWHSIPGLPPDQLIGGGPQDFNGTPDGNGTFTFLAGPFSRGGNELQHYFVVHLGSDQNHTIRSDSFDVNACDEPPAEPADPCLGVDLEATANADQAITLVASGFDGEATLMRMSNGESAEVAMLDAENDTFVDADVEAGVTYSYELRVSGESCATVEVTAIPVFPTLLAVGAAGLLGVGAYLGVRRRS